MASNSSASSPPPTVSLSFGGQTYQYNLVGEQPDRQRQISPSKDEQPPSYNEKPGSPNHSTVEKHAKRLLNFLRYSLLVDYGLGPQYRCSAINAEWVYFIRLSPVDWKSPGMKSIVQNPLGDFWETLHETHLRYLDEHLELPEYSARVALFLYPRSIELSFFGKDTHLPLEKRDPRTWSILAEKLLKDRDMVIDRLFPEPNLQCKLKRANCAVQDMFFKHLQWCGDGADTGVDWTLNADGEKFDRLYRINRRGSDVKPGLSVSIFAGTGNRLMLAEDMSAESSAPRSFTSCPCLKSGQRQCFGAFSGHFDSKETAGKND
ncbi:hypothetical protein K402DRAFT_81556 [Aulographum hederae CBS 113979]|uniref:Uncharacterized protein n=1 Tax=Aulographum hederae CBS 113979 TaxID=1176131 RepID=A0A6G1GZX3_9PEZI|nr:hypothetical protein K402DRAFT_81556 [Aulographum hederae CBS 113979]